jgi:hypothetical protein
MERGWEGGVVTDKSNHVNASDLAEKIIQALKAMRIDDEEDSYFLEGVNHGLKSAVEKVEEICRHEDVPVFVLVRR